ncbi:unnamed protein product, partial [Effrenium voratum]
MQLLVWWNGRLFFPMNLCAPLWPKATSTFWWAMSKTFQVATLHCFITGFRGDWKALKQVFNLHRHASTDE